MRYNNNYNNYYRNNNYSGDQRAQKKRSGAKESIQRKGKNEGKLAISAWNYSRKRGLITFSAFENKASKRVKAKTSGKRYVSMTGELIIRDTGEVTVHPIVYSPDTGKAYVEKLGMVISTKAPNGGYFGTVKKR